MKQVEGNLMVLKRLKILEVTDDYLLASKGYKVVKKLLPEGEWKTIATIPELTNRLLAHSRLIARLLRLEIYFMKTLSNGTLLAIARKGIFKLSPGEKHFKKCFTITRGTRPMNFAEDQEGNIYFGEYFHNAERDVVHIYNSSDCGESWKVAYTFTSGSIRHIHGIHFDPYTHRLWVTTGDLQNECVIGYTEDKFSSFVEVFRGGQECRTCKLLFTEKEIFYGTDSELEDNWLKVINRKSLEVRNLVEVQGSVINATQNKNLLYFNTTVEPSTVNKDQHSYIWMVDAASGHVKEIQKFGKDKWDHRYFQFGQCYFPENKSTREWSLYFSGCALKGIDGHSFQLQVIQ